MTTVSLATAQASARSADPLAVVRLWLAIVAALIVAMILVGGATRLTDSGLSITEWKPVTGVLLPTSAEGWTAELDKYRATPQYALINKGMGLPEFKSIYVWEWGHRLLGRLIGFAYLLPLLVFIARGTVRGRLMGTLLAIGALGGLQGAIGWIMVASGLQPGMIAVAPVTLMLHLVLACGILSAIVAVVVGLRPAPHPAPLTRPRPLPAQVGPARLAVDEYRTRASPSSSGERDASAVRREQGGGRLGAMRARLRFGAAAVLALLFVQIGLGALVAGLDAGLIYNTWPLMDGSFVPKADVLFPRAPWWANVFGIAATVQFNHRMGAYLLLAAAVLHAFDARRLAFDGRTAPRALVLAALVAAQAALGIVTLLLQAPLWAGLMHQGLAVVVLIAATAHWRRLAGVQTHLLRAT